MAFSATIKNAFFDELVKISGELQGHVRSGKKPIGVDRLLEKEVEEPSSPSETFPSGTVKTSQMKKVALLPAAAAVAVPLMAAGAYGHHVANKNINYWRTGRDLSKQYEQQQRGYR
jgi:hypothetical protein